MSRVTGPLDGIRVLELGTLIAGPFASRLLGDMGGCPFAPGATGNIATEDLVYLLRDSDVDVDVDLQAAIAAAAVARSVVGHELPSALLRAGDRMRNGA